MASTDSRPVPRKNTAFRYYFAIRKNDGTLITTWAGQDSEVSLDGAAFGDCTNEATEIGTSGIGYIDLTSSEMNADAVVLKVSVSNTSALPIVVTFFPEEVGDYRADVSASLTTFGVSTVTTAQVNAEVDTALADYDGPTNAEMVARTLAAASYATATALQTVDDEIATIDSNVDAILVDTAEIGAAGAGLTALASQTSVNDLPTNAELATALAAADDATLAAIALLNNVSSGDVQTAAAAALTAYDPPTNTEMEARTLAAAEYATATGVSAVETDTQDIQSRLPAALVGGRIDATVDATGMESGAIDAILDETIGDGTVTFREALRVLVAGMAGKLSGAATATVTIRNLADTADVVVATVDADGNRSAVTVTP